MGKFKSYINLRIFFIISILLIMIPFGFNKKVKKYNYKEKNPPAPTDRSDDPDKIMNEIQEAREKKDQLEIESQQKKIYVIALAVLSGVFLIIIIIYSCFKCYMICITTKRNNNQFQRIGVSRLGEVYLEENYNITKTVANDNNSMNNEFVNDKNEAPTCFGVTQQQTTFNPENLEDSNKFYKPMENN